MGACALAAALGACAPGPAPPPAAEPAPVELQLDAVEGGGLAVGAEIAGVPHRMLFDVGAGLTLLTPERAEELGCVPWGRVVLRTAAGEARSLRRCGEMSLRLGPLSLAAATAVLDPFDAARLADGLGGVASLQTLGARPVTLDLSGRRVILETDASLEARTAGMRPLEARLGHEGGGLATRLFLAAGTPRGPLWLLAGGGLRERTSLAPHALALLGTDARPEPGAGVAVSLDLPGLGRLERVAAVADGPWDGVLDVAALERLVLSVDLRDGRAWARWAER